jgi:hypothetical protein
MAWRSATRVTSPLPGTTEGTKIWKEYERHVLGTSFIGVGLATHRLLGKPRQTTAQLTKAAPGCTKESMLQYTLTGFNDVKR